MRGVRRRTWLGRRGPALATPGPGGLALRPAGVGGPGPRGGRGGRQGRASRRRARRRRRRAHSRCLGPRPFSPPSPPLPRPAAAGPSSLTRPEPWGSRARRGRGGRLDATGAARRWGGGDEGGVRPFVLFNGQRRRPPPARPVSGSRTSRPNPAGRRPSPFWSPGDRGPSKGGGRLTHSTWVRSRSRRRPPLSECRAASAAVARGEGGRGRRPRGGGERGWGWRCRRRERRRTGKVEV